MNRSNYLFPRTKFIAQGGVGLNFVPTDAYREEDLTSVVILGHSQVRRLSGADPGEVSYRGPEGDRSFRFRYFSASGANINSIRKSTAWQHAIYTKAPLTYIFIGGNDIHSGKAPNLYAEEIIQLVHEYENITKSFVKIIPIEARTNPRNISAIEYGQIINSVNRCLRRHPVSKDKFVAIPFRKDELCYDGIHLNKNAAVLKMRYLTAVSTKFLERTE